MAGTGAWKRPKSMETSDKEEWKLDEKLSSILVETKIICDAMNEAGKIGIERRDARAFFAAAIVIPNTTERIMKLCKQIMFEDECPQSLRHDLDTRMNQVVWFGHQLKMIVKVHRNLYECGQQLNPDPVMITIYNLMKTIFLLVNEAMAALKFHTTNN